MQFIKVTLAMKGEAYLNAAHIVMVEKHPSIENGSMVTMDFATDQWTPAAAPGLQRLPYQIGVNLSPEQILAMLKAE